MTREVAVVVNLRGAFEQAHRLSELWPLSTGPRTRHMRIPGILSSVSVDFDSLGCPTIRADNKADAILALGYITARARFFQMDMMRRGASGTLSEIFGDATVDADISQRVLGLRRVAAAALAQLSPEHGQLLDAYAKGVNAYLNHMLIPPLEYLALRARPLRWDPVDSILVGLQIMQVVTGTGEEQNERAMTVMHRMLPEDVFEFLTPDEDPYSVVLLGGVESRRPAKPVPYESLRALRCRMGTPLKDDQKAIDAQEDPKGSNGWVVAGKLAADGRAILANDMHLSLSAPNTWYRATLYYGDNMLAGITLPGLPVVVAGSNHHVAWGTTNINGDFLDLVELEINPNDPSQYRTPKGWREFETRRETVEVRGASSRSITVRETIWGPVSLTPLLGRQVAVSWIGLDPVSVDVNWIDMDTPRTLEDAVKVVQRCGGPPLNVMLADTQGRIGWTLCGRIPVRRGFNGLVSQSWADRRVGWDGYVPAHELPQVVDPPEGYLITANQRTVGKQYPHVLGHHFASGFRAHRIDQAVRTWTNSIEQHHFMLQLDTSSDFYNFYQALALEVLEDNVVDDELLSEVRSEVEAWDGTASLQSRGITILVQYREILAESLLGYYLAACKREDSQFTLRYNFETPLRALLTARHPETLPHPEIHDDWNAFLRFTLRLAASQLKTQHRLATLDRLAWGHINITSIDHPLSSATPWLRRLLSMPRRGLAGCAFSVRVADREHGAAMRMVVAPGHEETGILHMPCGQSGHPLSRHYRDQHRYWVSGRSLPFLAGGARKRLVLKP